MSTPLAIAAVAALAAAAEISRRGSRSLRPPEGFSVSSFEAVRGTVLEDGLEEWLDEEAEPGELPDPEERLYHVTTAADRVLTQGLKSRIALQAQRGSNRSFGLGGGVRNQASDLVSLALRLSVAERIERGLLTAIGAARGSIPPHEVALRVLEWSGFPFEEPWTSVQEELDRHIEELEEEDPDLLETAIVWDQLQGAVWSTIFGYGCRAPLEPVPARWPSEIRRRAAQIDRAWPGHDGGYRLLVKLERALGEVYDAGNVSHWIPFDNLVGFTESAENMARMDPGQVQILAVAARGRGIDFIPNEHEVRFRPDDVVVLGVVQ